METNISGKFSEVKRTFIVSVRLLKTIWSFDSKILVFQFVITGAQSLIPFINAFIYALIIDLIVRNIGRPFNSSNLIVLLGVRFLTLLVQFSINSIQSYIDLVTWSRLPIYLYQLILGKITNLEVEYFENPKFRDALQKVRESYAWMPLNMYTNIFGVIQALIQLATAFILLSFLNVFLAIGIIAAAMPSFLIQIKYSKTLWGVWDKNSPHKKRFWYLSDLIQHREAVKEMRVFGTSNKFLNEISRIQEKFANENLAVGKKRLRDSSILSFISSVIFILIEGTIAFFTILGKISLGGLSYFTFVVWNFEGGVASFFSSVSKTFNQSLYVEDIFKVLDLPQKLQKAEKPIKINTAITPKIEFKNVSFKYPGSKKYTLKDFSLTIHPGEKIAFVGENGAGKTTIIKLLARFYDVSSGEILIDGINIKELDLNSWYKTIGAIFQDFIKYEYTLAENIHLGKIYEPFNKSKIISAAKLSGTDKIAEKLEKGYDQMLGLTFSGGTELSLGQWQKVALGRAFLRDAPILILDEPTASIDAKAEKEIFDKVERLRGNKTVIIISHRFSTVRNADKIFVINKGKIAEEGNHKELLANNKIYAKLFKVQAEKYQ